MSNYVKTVNFAEKDSLLTGESGKRIRGTEINTEFDAIATAVASKPDAIDGTHTGTATFQNISVSGTLAAAFDWSNLVSTPTTLAGYGIVDAAAIDADISTLSSGAATDGQVPKADGLGGVAWEDDGGGDVTQTGTETLTNKTLDNPTLRGYTEQVSSLGTSGTVSLEPNDGTLSVLAVSGTITFTSSISTGQSWFGILTNPSDNTINWPTITWLTSDNTAPAISTTAVAVALLNLGGTLYGLSNA